MSFVEANDIFEISEKTVKVVVIHFKFSLSPEIKYDINVCRYEPPRTLQYDISLIHFNLDADFIQENYNLETYFKNFVKNEPSTQLLCYSYLDFTLENLTADAAIDYLSKIISTCQSLSHYQFKKTLYLAIPNTSFAIEKSTLPEFKILNIFYSKFNTFVKYTISNCDYIELYHTPEQKAENRLSCTLWFNYFIEKLNKCGFRRLVQFSGTCYLNTALNMFILNKYLKRIVIASMNTFMQAHPDLAFLITKPLTKVETYGCFEDLTAISLFFYNIIFNTCCKQKRPYEKESEDILRDYSRVYFCSDRKWPVFLQREGGLTWKTIELLLESANIPFSKTLDQLQYDIFLWHTFTYPFDIFEYMHSLDFEACACSIFVKEKSHVMVGFDCDGVKKVFDSATNRIFPYNWVEFRPKSFLSACKQFLPPFYSDDLKVYIESVIFLRRENMEKILQKKCFIPKSEISFPPVKTKSALHFLKKWFTN